MKVLKGLWVIALCGWATLAFAQPGFLGGIDGAAPPPPPGGGLGGFGAGFQGGGFGGGGGRFGGPPEDRGPGLGPDIWNHPEIREKLDLSDEQVEQLQSNNLEFETKMIEHRAKMEIARLKLESLLSSEEMNREEIVKQAEVIGNLHKDQIVMLADQKMSLRGVLNEEQMKKVEKFMKAAAEKIRDQRPGLRGRMGGEGEGMRPQGFGPRNREDGPPPPGQGGAGDKGFRHPHEGMRMENGPRPWGGYGGEERPRMREEDRKPRRDRDGGDSKDKKKSEDSEKDLGQSLEESVPK
jgi:hypothetical protein